MLTGLRLPTLFTILRNAAFMFREKIFDHVNSVAQYVQYVCSAKFVYLYVCLYVCLFVCLHVCFFCSYGLHAWWKYIVTYIHTLHTLLHRPRCIVSFNACLRMSAMLKAIPSMTHLSVCLSVTLVIHAWTAQHRHTLHLRLNDVSFSCRRLSQSWI